MYVKREVERLSRCTEEVMASVEEREAGCRDWRECRVQCKEGRKGGRMATLKEEGTVAQPPP